MDKASILQISRGLPEMLGPTTDMKIRSFVKMILFIVLGLVVRNQLLQITWPSTMTCLHREVHQVQFYHFVTTIKKIKAAWAKKTTLDRGNVIELQNLQKDFLLALFSIVSSTSTQSTLSTACSSIWIKYDFDFKIFLVLSYICTSYITITKIVFIESITRFYRYPKITNFSSSHQIGTLQLLLPPLYIECHLQLAWAAQYPLIPTKV